MIQPKNLISSVLMSTFFIFSITILGRTTISITNFNKMYRDFSKVQINGPTNQFKCKRFPTRLHIFVSDPQTDHIITWLPHGRSFKLLQTDLEPQDLQPYFKMTKVKSLIRQINGWGFHRVKEGKEKGSYYHEVSYVIFHNM